MQNDIRFHFYSIFFLLFLSGVFLFFFMKTPVVYANGGPSPCISDPVTFGNVEKKLLPLPSECPINGYCGRGENKNGEYAPSPFCVTPTHIVMHTTNGITSAEGNYEYFASGSDGREVASHFAVGADGKMMQFVEMGGSQVEYAQAVGPFDPHISIEMGSPHILASKRMMIEETGSQTQYDNVLSLVKSLMEQYNIPIENVITHKSKGGPAGDPGDGWMNDFIKDLPSASPLDGVTGGSTSGSRTDTSCWITAVGSPSEDDKPVCRTSSLGGPAGPCQQAPPPPGDIRQAIIDKWGITLDITTFQLPLAWEEFHEIDCTGFLQDIRGTTVGSWGNGYAQQFNCPGDGGNQVMFSNQWSGEFMKAILVHELTHVWQFCSEKGETNRVVNGSAFAEEGGVTNYSRTGCGFDVSLLNEDHADTIALYLNPEQGELTCGNGAPNPFANGGFPIHRGVAEQGVPKQNTSPQAPNGVGPQP